MAKKARFELGQYFAVPLLGGGFAYGYFTYYNKAVMGLCDVYDYFGDTEYIPDNIEEYPLIIRDLQISGSEFKLKPHEAEEFGHPWILSKRIKQGVVEPKNRLFLMGPRADPFIWDLFIELPKRPATDVEKNSLQHAGFAFPPVTANTIEIAIRRIDIDPDDFYPEDFPRN